MGMCVSKDRKDKVDEADRMILLSDTFDQLVEETLETFGTTVYNDLDSDLLERNKLPERTAPSEKTEIPEYKPMHWIELIKSLLRIVHIEHPMGPSVITLLLDDCPVLSNDSLTQVVHMITDQTLREERNICVILSCLAEKLDWTNYVLPKIQVLGYLVENLNECTHPDVMLFSLIALEKFAQKSENKATIKRKLSMFPENPLVRLERHSSSYDFGLRQVGYCAKWCLDNYFVIDGRKYSFETVDVSNVNVMLNTMGVSDYLKISPDGLEVRSDAYLFESVNSGCWYHECLMITTGVMQIGWTTKDSNFEGRGIGDDQHSISFDGCRRVIWHDNKAHPSDLPQWTGGSIVGCLLDLDAGEVIFSLNGIEGGVLKHEFLSAGDGFFAAASFMSYQQCRFNFGSEPFTYPPKNRPFNSLNAHAVLKPLDKIVFPRRLFVTEISEDSF